MRVNVTVSVDHRCLKRFDEWRGELSRGDALASLLRMVGASGLTQPKSETEAWLEGLGKADETQEPAGARLERARVALERAESGENKGAFDVAPEPTHPKIEKRDPMDQSPQYEDDMDQRPKGRRG